MRTPRGIGSRPRRPSRGRGARGQTTVPNLGLALWPSAHLKLGPISSNRSLPSKNAQASRRRWTRAHDRPPTSMVGGMNDKSFVGPTPRIARSRGYAISYEDAGEGSPVVLVPGYMQSAADYREAGYVDRLAAKHRVLIVDPLGHGRSDKPHEADAYRAPGVAADLIAVLDAAGLDRAALWGYSRGAGLAGMAAIEFPRRLTALILGGAALTQPPPTEMPPWVAHCCRLTGPPSGPCFRFH